jgi:4-carboxymuconolactone decarboxylase
MTGGDAGTVRLQFTEQQHTSLSERVRQVVILTVGAIWRADYELYSHSAAARQAGLSDAAIATLVNGEMPDDLTEQEKIAHRVVQQLSTSHHVDDRLYRETEKVFGAAGVAEITVLAGIYHTVCALLNVFDVPAPQPQQARPHRICVVGRAVDNLAARQRWGAG